MALVRSSKKSSTDFEIHYIKKHAGFTSPQTVTFDKNADKGYIIVSGARGNIVNTFSLDTVSGCTASIDDQYSVADPGIACCAVEVTNITSGASVTLTWTPSAADSAITGNIYAIY